MTLPPLAAEPLFHIGSFPVTNAYVNSTITVVLFVLFAFIVNRSIRDVPGRLQSFVETIFETLLGYFDQVTNDRAKSKRFLPFVGTIFLFILISNWMGQLPGTGTIGRWLMHEGHLTLIPILRPATSDLNLTIAIALISVIGSHLLGMFTLGFFTHWNKFIQLGTIWKALKTLNPVKILTAVVEFIVGIIELFSEVAKIVSLSLRLFGNIFAGEVLMTVIAGLFAYAMPLPFMVLELIVGIVQATVFALLTLVYLTVASTAPHGDEEHAEAHPPQPATHAAH
jgi:F-type H+-transporting ATPase subunit a